MEVELLDELLLDPGADAVAEEGPVGDDNGGAGGPSHRCSLVAQLAHDELQEEERRLGGLLVIGEVPLDALFLLAAEGRVCHDHVHPVLLADLGQLETQGIARIDPGGVEAVEEEVHLAEQIRQGFGLAAEKRSFLEDPAIGDSFDLHDQVIIRLDEKAAGAGCGVKDGLAKLRIGDGHHETHDGARGVELARIPGGVAHLAEHRFVERAQGMELARGGEVDPGDLVDHVAQEIAADHAVLDAGKDGGDHVAAVVAVGAGEPAKVGEKPRTARAVGPGALLLVDEGEQFVAGDSLGTGGPVTPAVGWFDGRSESLSGEGRLRLALEFQIVEELEKHDPGEHRQAVEVAVEALVLAHDVAGGLEQAAEGLGGGLGLVGFLGGSCHLLPFYAA